MLCTGIEEIPRKLEYEKGRKKPLCHSLKSSCNLAYKTSIVAPSLSHLNFTRNWDFRFWVEDTSLALHLIYCFSMASISYQNKVFHVLGLLSFLLVIEKSNAFQFPVGGDLKGWTVPDNTSSKNHYNDWANITRFQIGDSLCKLTFCPKISSFNRTYAVRKSWYFVNISPLLLQCFPMILAKTRCFR